MDAFVQNGKTNAIGDTLLVSKSFTSESGEHAFLLLQIAADSATARTIASECETVVTHALLETEGEAAQRLDSTLKELNGLIKGFILSKTIEDYHAIVGIVETSAQLHVSHAGRAEAYVVRAMTASQITEYTRGKPSPHFVHIASGQLEAGDTIILSSQRLLRTVTPAQLAQISVQTDGLLQELQQRLESEQEQASLMIMHIEGSSSKQAKAAVAPKQRSRPSRRRQSDFSVQSVFDSIQETVTGWLNAVGRRTSGSTFALPAMPPVSQWGKEISSRLSTFLSDLQDPLRKRRAHFILLAAIIAIFLFFWAIAHVASFGQRSQTKAQIEEIIQKVDEEITNAENRRLVGDTDSANAILARAEQQAKQVMNNESGLYRTEALDLFDRIRAKREQINNIIRLSPTVVANLAANHPDIKSVGFIGLPDEEFIVYDKQDLYRTIHNSVEDPDRMPGTELVLHGINFPRYQTNVFQTTGNQVIEYISGQPTSMKTEDTAGWITGKSIEAYLRFLYVLSPENNQIYKYERLSNRYSSPTEYNVNGELSDAIDIAIDGNVFVLKEGGSLIKLLRGETQPFSIRNAPDGVLSGSTKVFKVFDGDLYLLDPNESRVIVLTDGGATGESSYIKQFVFEGDQVGELQDLYIDSEETRLYVLDEKRIYKVDLGPQ